MPDEIESAIEIAEFHVEIIKTANTDFTTVGNAPSHGFQLNEPTNKMRSVFENVTTVCTNLSSYMERDVEKIILMAEEFELWDQQMWK